MASCSDAVASCSDDARTVDHQVEAEGEDADAHAAVLPLLAHALGDLADVPVRCHGRFEEGSRKGRGRVEVICGHERT